MSLTLSSVEQEGARAAVMMAGAALPFPCPAPDSCGPELLSRLVRTTLEGG
jgi:hypothetical protein